MKPWGAFGGELYIAGSAHSKGAPGRCNAKGRPYSTEKIVFRRVVQTSTHARRRSTPRPCFVGAEPGSWPSSFSGRRFADRFSSPAQTPWRIGNIAGQARTSPGSPRQAVPVVEPHDPAQRLGVVSSRLSLREDPSHPLACSEESATEGRAATIGRARFLHDGAPRCAAPWKLSA